MGRPSLLEAPPPEAFVRECLRITDDDYRRSPKEEASCRTCAMYELPVFRSQKGVINTFSISCMYYLCTKNRIHSGLFSTNPKTLNPKPKTLNPKP